MHDWNWYNCGMQMMWLIWLPLVILIVWFVIRQIKKNEPSEQIKESPMEVLKRRYANGELTTEEYEQRKQVLDRA